MNSTADSRKAAEPDRVSFGRDFDPRMDTSVSIFHDRNRKYLQADIRAGRVDSDALLPDVVEYIDTKLFNLYANLETGEHSASPVCRKGNPQYAFRQQRKRKNLNKILKKCKISVNRSDGVYSHLFFMTLTIDHKVMSRDDANFFITSKGRGISRFFARFEKIVDGGYSKVITKESTISGYPAAHVLLHLAKPLKVKYHRKSRSYRPDISDPYTRKVLGSLKNLGNWNSISPLWKVGFIDIYAFTEENMSIRGYSSPINYISKYITKSLDLDNIEELRKCKRVSELPEKYRTAVWTILNSLIWNTQAWVISKDFKEDLQKIDEKIEEHKGKWVWIDTVHRTDPRLYEWMGYDIIRMNPETFRKGPPDPI